MTVPCTRTGVTGGVHGVHSGLTAADCQTVTPTKGAACRNMAFITTYGETVWNMTVLNLDVDLMLKVGGVSDGSEQKSQESAPVSEKVLQLRGTGPPDVGPLTRLSTEKTVIAA